MQKKKEGKIALPMRAIALSYLPRSSVFLLFPLPRKGTEMWARGILSRTNLPFNSSKHTKGRSPIQESKNHRQQRGDRGLNWRNGRRDRLFYRIKS
ncbi:MAG: hypothetical protein HC833_07030 [Leptolyngbyaceae cyanobacterium RM1_406_9]|nr:hypothetical protein [Leptolyngbyaceae cyanobacterium RM1_406_9]